MPHKTRKAELSSNMEDYLETIYLQDLAGEAAKVKNIADAMGVSKPSVTEALSVLQDRGLVLHQKYGDIELTEKGRNTASDIYHRHQLFHELFSDVLKISENQAEDDACRVEHLVSEETTRKIEAFLEFVREQNQENGQKQSWLQNFHKQLEEKDLL